MKGYLALFLLALAFANHVHAQDEATEAPPVETTAGPVEPTEAPTEAPTTAAPKQPTTAPSEVTTQAGETTAAPEQPTTATSAPSTMTPPVNPPKGSFNVTDSAGNVCILMTMAVRWTFNYTSTKQETTSHDLPVNIVATGNCANETQTISMKFNGDWELKFEFEKVDSDKQFSVKTASFTYNMTEQYFPGITTDKDRQFVNSFNLSDVKASVGNSYLCTSDQTMTLVKDKTTMKLSEFQAQAFRSSKDGKFGDPQECPADSETSNIVPIAVGAALAALVVIVLIAYLISRNRNKGGYESV